MRVLVTGAGGYLGAVIAPMLADAGHDVTGLDIGYYEGCDFGSPPSGVAGRVVRDVRDVGPDELEGFDAVVHLAALSNDPLGDLQPELTFDINLHGSVRLADAARDAGVRRFVFASSCAIYGASDADDLLDESAPLRPLTAYAESKVRAEEEILAANADGFCAVSMRNSTVYGVSPRLRLDVVLNNLAASAHTTGAITLTSDGSSWRPLIHVRDVGLVTRRLLEASEEVVGGQAYNVGSANQNYRIRNVAEALAECTGCAVEFAGGASPDPRSYRVDFTKLERALPGLELEWDADKGSRELVDAYRVNGLSLADFEGRRYVRLRQLRYLIERGELDGSLRRSETPVAGAGRAS